MRCQPSLHLESFPQPPQLVQPANSARTDAQDYYGDARRSKKISLPRGERTDQSFEWRRCSLRPGIRQANFNAEQRNARGLTCIDVKIYLSREIKPRASLACANL